MTLIPRTVAWKAWEFECPKCHEIGTVDDAELWIWNGNEAGYSVKTFCRHCQVDIEVFKDD